MAEVTVEQLAKEIGTPADRLVTQLADAGISKTITDSVTEQEKETLLEHLKKQHGDDSAVQPSKMTLSRKKKTTLSVGSGSKAKSVQVEVRKKRTYVKRSDVEEQQIAEAEAKAAEEAEAIIDDKASIFSDWLNSLDSVDLIKEYREQSLSIKDELLERAINQLQSGNDTEQVLKELANKLTNKLIHAPTSALKEAAEKQNSDELVVIKTVLGIR